MNAFDWMVHTLGPEWEYTEERNRKGQLIREMFIGKFDTFSWLWYVNSSEGIPFVLYDHSIKNHQCSHMMETWVAYLKKTCEEEGQPGVWVQEQYDDHKSIAFIPANERGERICSLRDRWGILCQEVEEELREKSTLPSFFKHTHFMITPRAGMVYQTEYHHGGRYDHIRVFLKTGCVVKDDQGVEVDLADLDEPSIKQWLVAHIEQKTRKRKLRELLTPPQTEFDRKMVSTLDQCTRDTVYHTLCQHYEAWEIEVFMKEWSVHHTIHNGLCFASVFDHFLVVEWVGTEKTHLHYMGKDFNQAFACFEEKSGVHSLDKEEARQAIEQWNKRYQLHLDDLIGRRGAEFFREYTKTKE